MVIKDIEIRPATAGDASFVAWTVLTALDINTDEMDEMIESCADEKSMYSWKNALIAYDGGEAVGCIVAYDGDTYPATREYTWGKLWKDVDKEIIRNSAIEALPGEYYLDSLAIKSEYRGRGIGKRLMCAAMEHGKSLGYDSFSLLVAIDKPNLESYYCSLGFCPDGSVQFFGHMYNRLILNKP